MDISHLQRDKARVHAALTEVNDSLVAVQPCKIYIPESYLSSKLGSIDESIRILGIFCIVVEDQYYAISRACALIETEPSSHHVVTIHEESYREFSYNKGAVLIKNLNLVRTGTLVYRIYDEFITKGKVPWYIDYRDICFLFDTALLHGNANLGADSALLELFAAAIARQGSDRVKYYRHHPVGKPYYIPMSSVAYGATNTTAKLLGAYFNEGITSALVNPSERNESIEDILRK